MRKKLIGLHLWLGLTIGLLWALQGMSGALLVFHRDIDRFAGPVVSAGPMVSLDMIAEHARNAAEAPIERIGILDDHGAVLAADYHDRAGIARLKLIDAASGRIVGAREREPPLPTTGSAWIWLYRFHDSLAGGDHLAVIVGLSGFILFASVAAGLVIGWPRRGAYRAAFAVYRWHSRDQKLYGWHRVGGLIAGLVLLITVPCGIYMIFAADVRPYIARLVPHSLPFRATPVSALPAPMITPQQAYLAGRAHFPAAAFVSLTIPSVKAPVYTVRLRQDAEPRAWAGMTSVTIDPASGRTLHVYDAVEAPLSNQIVDAAFAIHSGEISGIFGRILVMLAGLALPTLYVTGVWAWLRRYRRKAKSRTAKPKCAAINDVAI